MPVPTTDESDIKPSARRCEEPPADILVVDDNKPNLAAIEVALGDLGRRLVKAASGEEALRHLLTHDFALIILDVQMPHMDGFETARLIRERKRSRHVPIIFITAHNRNDEQVLEAYKLGASDFMFKPIVPEVLRAKAKVFVDLQDRTAENERQARLLAQMERREIERKAAMERERWEAELVREESRQKDEFLAVLAHELRNPLSPIVTGIQLLKPYARDEKLQRVRDMMERQSRHLVRLIDDLLDVARISSGKINVQIEPVELQNVIRQAADSVTDLVAQKQHTLEVQPPAEPLVVAADPVRLTQVVANLLNNAARYTDPGGRISVSCARDGDMAVIRVADNGRGIAPQMLHSIFDRFVQEDGGAGGLGLGLALVQRLVSMHGGRVRAFSEGRGKGSEFCVWIPLAGGDAAASRDEPPPATVETSEETALSIVLIEDEEDIRTSMCTLLEGWGHKVKVAADGAKGLKLIARHKPHAAIVDIAMPGIDGYEVARRVRARGGEPRTRLIAMTGFGRERDRERALNAGFDQHITKPARPEDLQRALRSGRWR